MNNHANRQRLSKEYCSLFFKNIDYLRRSRGLTLIQMKRGMLSDGYSPSLLAIRRYKMGVYTSASIYYLAAFALYFGRSVPELMSVDLEAEETRKNL